MFHLLLAQDAGVPMRIKIVVLEGEGAINNISQHRAKEPVVRIVDENNAAISGASVTFLLPESGPAAEFPGGLRSLAGITDEKGEIAGRGLSPNKVEGRYQIRVIASFGGYTDSAVINQTNAEGATASSGFPKKFLVIGAAVAAVAAGAAFAAGGHHGSTATTAPASQPAIIIVSGTPSFQPPH